MDAQRFDIKLYFAPEAGIELERLIPIFHRWIQTQALDELLIDVADYKHVPNGPGVLLIAHGALYAVDASDGRLGLLYGRKRPSEGSFAERLRDGFRKLLLAAQLLENEPSLGLRIPGDQLTIRIQDRLLAPNDERTLAALRPTLNELLSELYGGAAFRLHHEEGAGTAFGIRVETVVQPGVAALLERLEGRRAVA